MDIINEIIHDHRRLRELLDKVKAGGAHLRTKKSALRELIPLVKAHARAEEKTIYAFAQKKRELRLATLEHFEEHAAALLMSAKASKAHAADVWLARAIVFCEMLEHHLDEEENEYFPSVRRVMDSRQSDELATRYRALMPPADTKRGPRAHPAFLRPITAPSEAFMP